MQTQTQNPLTDLISPESLLSAIKTAKDSIKTVEGEKVIDSIRVFDKDTLDCMLKILNVSSVVEEPKVTHFFGIPIKINNLMPKNSFGFFSGLEPIKIFILEDEAQEKPEPHQEFCHYCRTFMPHERVKRDDGKRSVRCCVCERIHF